ncbi:hypothetical protein CesoFtcFv8_020387 [Champsocephalus esox]|uniref:Uncharacterized protein n=1 Tax=Champsocephalus esox TaxID=159716 RepID=A0AAN8GP63_9TELE|nr:hypothetical protein CesoFtcFv8_020387 [Champsocephalus esox]
MCEMCESGGRSGREEVGCCVWLRPRVDRRGVRGGVRDVRRRGLEVMRTEGESDGGRERCSSERVRGGGESVEVLERKEREEEDERIGGVNSVGELDALSRRERVRVVV